MFTDRAGKTVATGEILRIGSLVSTNSTLNSTTTMKVSIVSLLLLPAATMAFAPRLSRPAFTTCTQLSAVPGAATTKEEDLELTRKIIMDHLAKTADEGVIPDDDEEEAPAAPKPEPETEPAQEE